MWKPLSVRFSWKVGELPGTSALELMVWLLWFCMLPFSAYLSCILNFTPLFCLQLENKYVKQTLMLVVIMAWQMTKMIYDPWFIALTFWPSPPPHGPPTSCWPRDLLMRSRCCNRHAWNSDVIWGWGMLFVRVRPVTGDKMICQVMFLKILCSSMLVV